MPMHAGLIPREGLTAGPVFRLLSKLVLNPRLLLPLILLARFTRKGRDLAILHPTAHRRLRLLLVLAVARRLNRWLSDGALNNWLNDRYDWGGKEVVLVTGGAGGIGGEMVKLFAGRGIKTVVLDIQPMTFEAPPNVHYFNCDITSPAQLAEVAGRVRAQVGHPTVLINNAGVLRGRAVLEATERDVRLTYDVNVLAHHFTAREFVPRMATLDHGMVVTVASFAAMVAVPGQVDYAASKAAAAAFHEGLAAELATTCAARRVRSVLVLQGHTRTRLVEGYDRGGGSSFAMPVLEPETVAEAVVAQVLTGRSGHVVVPGAGNLLTALRAMPHWYQVRVRNKGQSYMAGFRGRQVVEELERLRAEKVRGDETEESTVLVEGE